MSAMIPEGWIKASLSEVVAVNPKHTDLEDQVAGFVPMALAPTDFNGTLNYEERQWNDIKKGYTHFATGDIIFAKVTPCFENGKAAIVKDMPNGIGAGSTEFYVLRPLLDSISSDYIFSVIKSYEFLQTGAENMTGAVGLRRVPKKFVEDFKINLPPLAEQKVIADKLDELLAQVESTKARLDAIPAILRSFRQSVLAAAVSGKLTEEWRELNKIDLATWQQKNIGLLADVATGKTPKRTISKYWNSGTIPWLTSAATGSAFIYQAEQFVTEIAVTECTLKVFPVGTLLLAMYGEGKTRGQVTEIKLSATCNQACAAIMVDESKISREFLKLRLLENYEETRKAAVGGAQPNLNLNKVREIPVQLPTTEEQTEIVRRVEALFAFADKVEAQVNAAQARVNNLTQSILAKAFRGELTAEWRAANPELISGDNSAESLLKRIKAERAAMGKKSKQAKV
ncbi:type I restriction endonuclease subunit S [Shewanella baltica]|uniref:restriction endonuclease subunit S n=1 Tax=Shewanella baltica TaxID=62322 RepID=UPI00217D000C|nr:restriction endonuclease subunit S [Shewanella baltica]MCS6126953.1 type I restriction endonuclease subunit S [Shewanella baltica]MCS6139247.1 type I restriction endonuclease subunit S [Shewanella baltica]MCS6145387.1 type I restriction endonuclease subunit S [Shewanella baltica]MCS6169917.1 type I restriction endonuclease subunit S [Shewanella baltica]MCS6187141.1 type I restriction endonuclease subunit S [Shewanella baltica]